MGFFGDPVNRFRDYLDNKGNDDQVRCAFCNKTRNDILREYEEYMENPSQEFEDLTLDDLIIMTEKLQKPVCAGCYFAIKNNVDLVNEIFDRPEDEVW